MNTHRNEIGRRRDAAAIGIWEYEGGAPGSDSMDYHYGRRIETDRSWTVYHVFTGITAVIDGAAMTGLSHLDATDGMLSLNHRNAARRTERNRLSPLHRTAWWHEAGAYRS